MSSLVRQTRQLERVIRRKEKIFLMEQYATSMLQQLEPVAAEGAADEQVLDALRIAYRYVNPELGGRLSALLVAFGFTGDLEVEREAADEAEAATFEEEGEEEEAKPRATKKGRPAGAAADGTDAAEEDEEAGVLFERDIYTGRKGAKKPPKPGEAGEDEDDAADLFADEDEAGDADAADLFADEDEADEDADPKDAAKKKGKARQAAPGDEDEADAADLFADEDEAGDADAADLFADEDEAEDTDAADLFADEDEAEDADPKTAAKRKGKARKAAPGDEDEADAADLFADEDEAEDADAADLFAGEDEADEDADPKAAAKKKGKARKAAPGDEDEADAADLFADEDEAEDADAADLFADEDEADEDAEDDTEPKTAAKKKGKARTATTDDDDEGDDADPAGDEENEDAGALFEQDIYTAGKKKKKKKKRARAGQEEGDEIVELAVDEEAEARRLKANRKGHTRKETPGFAAPESAVERDEKSRRGYDLYAPDESAEKAQDAKAKARRRPPAIEEEEEEEEEEAQERKETKPKRDPRAAAEEDKEESSKKGREALAPDPKAEEKKLNLDALAFQVAVEDLRTHMGITLVREDHIKLMRRWEQKSRDNSIRLLLDDPKATQHPYALVPRIHRFIKDGQIVPVNVLNLVRHFFQLFENVPQVVQLKTEPFFVTEVPTLEWAVVACEALPDTLNKTVLEQRTVFGHYIQKFMSNERRVRRRVLVEALYDIIVLNMVCKEPILRKTVDLTETRRGRQTQMCVNFGAKGIRISSIGRDQRHPQMGMCPSW